MNILFNFFFILLLGSVSFAENLSVAEICSANEEAEVVSLSPEMCDLGTRWQNTVTQASYVDVYQQVTQCKQTKPFYYTNMPWLLLRSPRIEVRKVAHIIQEELATQIIKQVSDGKNQTPFRLILAESAKKAAVYSDQVSTKIDGVIARAAENESMNSYLDEAEAYTAQICLIFADPGCAETLKDAFRINHVISLYNKEVDMQISVTMVDDVRRLFEESHFSQGLSIAAIRISQLAEDAQKGNLPTTHLLDDLVSSFEEAGYDSRSALDMSFTFLSFYGTRGASMVAAVDLVTSENQSVMLSSMVIASSLGILDFYTLASAHPYSLPKSVTTHCTYGSPYHFWMPAALAWRLVERNHSARSAMISAHILGVGYEVLASTISRNPWEKLTIPSLAISSDGVRINIAMNDAGARFGAEMAAEKHISKSNIDSRIKILIKSSANLPALTIQEASQIFKNKFLFVSRWLLIFTPNAGLFNMSY